MTTVQTLVNAAADALGMPVYPAPARGGFPCAVYRFTTGASDGSYADSRFEIRIFAGTASAVQDGMQKLRRTLVRDGDSGVLADEGGNLLIRQTDEGSGAGYLHDCGIYFMKAGFDVRGRA